MSSLLVYFAGIVVGIVGGILLIAIIILVSVGVVKCLKKDAKPEKIRMSEVDEKTG